MVTDISENPGASMAIQSLDEVGSISRSSTNDSEIIVIYEDQASVGIFPSQLRKLRAEKH